MKCTIFMPAAPPMDAGTTLPSTPNRHWTNFADFFVGGKFLRSGPFLYPNDEMGIPCLPCPRDCCFKPSSRRSFCRFRFSPKLQPQQPHPEFLAFRRHRPPSFSTPITCSMWKKVLLSPPG